MSGVQSALDEGRRPVYATPATSSASSAYDKWLADTAPPTHQISAYGQTDGPYAGWATIGSMNGAIGGRAQILRDQSREMFGALDQMANEIWTEWRRTTRTSSARTGCRLKTSARACSMPHRPSSARSTQGGSATHPAMTDLDGGYRAGVADNAFGGDLVHPENLLGSTVPQAGPTVQRSSNESGVGYSSAGSQPLSRSAPTARRSWTTPSTRGATAGEQVVGAAGLRAAGVRDPDPEVRAAAAAEYGWT